MNSTEEYFDVVDSEDNVIDRKPRSTVHRDRLLHRAVHVFLFRSDNRMLIHLRTDSKEEFPAVWTSSCSGHVSSGESYSVSAERELEEELGISADLQKVLKVAACPDTSLEFTELFVAQSDAKIQPDPIEIADVRWLPLEEIQAELGARPSEYSPAFRLLFSQFMANNTARQFGI